MHGGEGEGGVTTVTIAIINININIFHHHLEQRRVCWSDSDWVDLAGASAAASKNPTVPQSTAHRCSLHPLYICISFESFYWEEIKKQSQYS